MNIGQVFSSNNYGDYEIIGKNPKSRFTIRFLATGHIKDVHHAAIGRGNIKDPLVPVVCGIGVFGDGSYRGSGKHSRVYMRWVNILRRCYDETLHEFKWYGAKGVTVHPDWFNYQVFAEWYEKQCKAAGVPLNNKLQIDKDILNQGEETKMYGPDTCTLTSVQSNIEAAHAGYYSLMSPKGRKYYGTNRSAFARKHGLEPSQVSLLMSGGRGNHRGWTRAVI